jgi:hypothetical protein
MRAVSMEHRWGHRIDCGARVRLCASGAIAGAGRLRNVSMSGAFIETSVDLPLFARIAVSVVRSGPEPLQEPVLLATVVRVAHDGVGVEWRETAPRDICPLLGCASPCAAATAFHAPKL